MNDITAKWKNAVKDFNKTIADFNAKEAAFNAKVDNEKIMMAEDISFKFVATYVIHTQKQW